MKSVSDLITRLKMPTGLDSTLIKTYISDALREIQSSTDEDVYETLMTITSGIEQYNYPADMVRLISTRIDIDVTNYSRYYLEPLGRVFRIRYLNDATDILETPSTTIVDAVKIVYTAYKFPFVLAPDGTADVGDFATTPTIIYTTASGTQSININDVVYIADGYRVDYGIRYHYYQALSTLGSTDLGAEDYTDTARWSDATSPKLTVTDGASYIGVEDNFYDAVFEYVKKMIAEETDDIKLERYRELKFNDKKNKAMDNRKGNTDIAIPKSPFSIG